MKKYGRNKETIARGLSKERLQKFKKDGIKKVVITREGVAGLEPNDAVFSTREEMVKAITKIANTFSALHVSIDPVLSNDDTNIQAPHKIG